MPAFVRTEATARTVTFARRIANASSKTIRVFARISRSVPPAPFARKKSRALVKNRRAFAQTDLTADQDSFAPRVRVDRSRIQAFAAMGKAIASWGNCARPTTNASISPLPGFAARQENSARSAPFVPQVIFV